MAPQRFAAPRPRRSRPKGIACSIRNAAVAALAALLLLAVDMDDAAANHFNPSDLEFGLHCSPDGWDGGPSAASMTVAGNRDREFGVGWNRLPTGPVAHIRYRNNSPDTLVIKQDEDDGPADGAMRYALVESAGLVAFRVDDAQVTLTLGGPGAYAVVAATYTGRDPTAWISWEVGRESGRGNFRVDAACVPQTAAPQPASLDVETRSGTARANASEALEFRVTVRDGSGDTIPGVEVFAEHDGRDVRFTNPGGERGVTNSSGEVDFRATSSTSQSLTFTFTERDGGNSVAAEANFRAEETQPETGLRLSLVSGDAQHAPAGDSLAEPLVVRLVDDDGDAVAGHEIRFSFQETPPGATGQRLDTETVRTDSQGLASTTARLGRSAGAYGIRAAAGESGPAVTFTATAEADDERALSFAFSDATYSYLTARMDRLLASEPRRYRLAHRHAMESVPGEFAWHASGDDNRLDGQFVMSRRPAFSPFDFWAEGQYSGYSHGRAEDRQRGGFGVLFAGVDYRIEARARAGVMAQADWAGERSTGRDTRLSGSGWMLGPYISAELTPGVYLDARAAYGRSHNRALLGLLTEEEPIRGSFETTRWMLRANLAGAWENEHWLIKPEASAAYLRENRDAFTVSTHDIAQAAIEGQRLGLGRLSAGPEVSYRVTHRNMLIAPFVHPRLLWDFRSAAPMRSHGEPSSPSRWRGSAQGGVRFGSPFGVVGEVSAGYDGFGRSGWAAYSLRLSLSVPLPP